MNESYNPHKRVLEFSSTHDKALDLLKVYNENDPFHCYYGDESNPDEYLGYATRLLNNLQRGMPVDEAVEQSFHPGQLEDGFLSEIDIQDITIGVAQVWND